MLASHFVAYIYKCSLTFINVASIYKCGPLCIFGTNGTTYVSTANNYVEKVVSLKDFSVMTYVYGMVFPG